MKVKFFSFNDNQSEVIRQVLDCNKNFLIDENDYELVIVIGGDGTFLNALNTFKNEEVKLVLINQGKLGFFSNIDNNLQINLDKKKFETYPILTLKSDSKQLTSINEVIFSSQNNPIKYDILINDDYWYTSFASGFIVSTRNGSSGVNRSLHGPLLTNKNQFIYQEFLPVISSQTTSVLQPVVFNIEDELTFKVHQFERNNLFIKADGVFNNWEDLCFKISLTQSKAKIYQLNFHEWINKINEKLLGEKNETKY